MDSRTYTTKNIELGSAIKTVAHVDPDVCFHDGSGIASLEFPLTQAVADVVMRYESGSLLVDARTLLTVRNQLYRRIKRGTI